MEDLAAKNGKALADVPREQMEEFWETAKRSEKSDYGKSVEAHKG
jgi:hypothetical protein